MTSPTEALKMARDALAALIGACKQAKVDLTIGIRDGDPVHPVSAALTWPLATAINGLAALDALPQRSAPTAPNSRLLDRAEALHLNTGMHWREAERLALSEVGVDDAAITELVGECTALGTESLLTGEEICDFARAVLVHGSGLMVALPTEDQGAMRHLLRIAETVRDWMGDGCNPDATPKPQIAALAEFCGSTASGMLAATPAAPGVAS